MVVLPEILPDQRVVFVGKTGAGKTFLAHSLLIDVNRLLVLDAKGTLFHDDWNLEKWTGNHKAMQTVDEPFRIRVPFPIDGDWSPYLWEAYNARNCTIYIDEVYGVEKGTNPSDALRACITRGRELGIGVWSATQRPASIPMIVLSESDWIFEFQLRLDVDRKRIADIIGKEALEPLSGHEVIVYHDSMETPIKFAKVNINITQKNQVEETLSFREKVAKVFSARDNKKKEIQNV